jgi:hypothetical protein
MQVSIGNSAHFYYTSHSPRTHCKCNCCNHLMLIHNFQTLNIDLKCSPPNTTPSPSPGTIINLNILANCDVRSSQQVPAHLVWSNPIMMTMTQSLSRTPMEMSQQPEQSLLWHTQWLRGYPELRNLRVPNGCVYYDLLRISVNSQRTFLAEYTSWC